MLFSSPFFLYLLPGAILPVIFHFIFRQKKKKIVYSTLMFFYRTDPKIASRHRLRQFLILLCRVLVLFFLISALCRPVIFTGSDAGSNMPVVVIIDNSGSMARPSELDESRSCLDIARSCTSNLLANLTVGQKGSVLGLVGDQEISGDELSVSQSSATGNLPGAIVRAEELLGDIGGVIHIFTDMQRNEIGGDGRLALANNVAVRIHRINPKEPDSANVAISDIVIQNPLILPGHPCPIEVVLENNSNFEAAVTITVVDSSGALLSADATIGSMAVRAVPFILPGMATGTNPVSVRVAGDGFEPDNTGSAVIKCAEPVEVLFGGSRREFGLIPLALSPFDNPELCGVRTVFRSLERLLEYSGENESVMVVLTYKGSLELEEKSPGWQNGYVETGGNILIVPSVNEKDSVGGSVFDGISIGALASGVSSELEPAGGNSLLWYRIFGKNDKKIDKARCNKYFPLTVSGGVQGLLDCDVKTVLAQKEVGAGNVFVSGLAFDKSWSELPGTPLMVVLLQNMVTMRGGEDEADSDIVKLSAGMRLEDARLSGEVRAISIAGTNYEYSGSAGAMPVFSDSSVVLVDGENVQLAVAVSASSVEGEMNYLARGVRTIESLPIESHSLDTVSDEDEYNRPLASVLQGHMMYSWCVLAAFCFLIFESLLANRVYSSGGRN